MRHKGRDGCKVVGVSRDACYVRFGMRTAVVVESRDDGRYRTARGEDIIFDFDADGHVVGLELVGPGKACQEVKP